MQCALVISTIDSVCHDWCEGKGREEKDMLSLVLLTEWSKLHSTDEFVSFYRPL